MTDAQASMYVSAANTAVQAAGMWASNDMNYRTRMHAKEMYAQQRADNLSDWHMQNEYNSPTSQMARLRAAGLNPNLVYGKGADAQAGSVNQAAPQSWNPKPVDFSGLANSLFAGYDLRLKEAQYDNLRSQNTVLLQDKLLKEAQTISTLSGAAKTDQDREFAASLFPGTAEGQRLLNEKTGTETRLMLNADERATIASNMSVIKGVEEVIQMRLNHAKTQQETANLKQALTLLKQDESIKALDVRLAGSGIRPQDGWQQTIAKIILDKILGNKEELPDATQGIKGTIKRGMSIPGTGRAWKWLGY